MLKILTSLLPKHIHGFNVDGTRDARFENLTLAKLLGVMTRKDKSLKERYKRAIQTPQYIDFLKRPMKGEDEE